MIETETGMMWHRRAINGSSWAQLSALAILTDMPCGPWVDVMISVLTKDPSKLGSPDNQAKFGALVESLQEISKEFWEIHPKAPASGFPVKQDEETIQSIN
jgi:hypothetical protein